MDSVYFNLLPKPLFSNDKAAFAIVTDQEVIAKWKKAESKRLIKNKKPESYTSIGVVLDDPYLLVLRDLVQFPNGKLGTYIRIIHQHELVNGVGVVVLPQYRGKLVLLHQYRHATRAWHYEIPRGFGEPNISAEDNAHKEISEETGGKIKNLIALGSYHTNTGLENNQIQLFYVELESIGEPDIDEGIDGFRFVTTEELEEMIRSEEITDGFTIAAYTRAKLRGSI